MAKRSKKLPDADAFRALVERLRTLAEADWGDWEADWLDDEARRPEDYVYTEKERVILNQLIASSTPFEGYNGWSVPDLLKVVYRYRAVLDEAGERFVEALWRLQPRALRVRQLIRLAGLARLFEPIGRDEQVEVVLRQTRTQEDELQNDLPDWLAAA